MAKTTQAGSTATNEAVRQIWIEKLFREMIVESYFMPRFSGEGKDNIVQVQTDLTKTRGDRMNFGITFKLSGAGVTSGTTLEGNEESLSDDMWTIVLEQYRHAVRDDGAMTRQRKFYDVDAESRSAIVNWGAEKIDTLIFNSLNIASNSTGAIYTSLNSGSPVLSTSTKAATVTATDKLDLDFISFIKTIAKTGANREFNPIIPIKVEGKNYYVLLVHPEVLYDLRVDSQFQQAMREAQARGNDNPLFKTATAIWDNVVIHEHERVPIAATYGAGSNVAGAECYLLGQQAIVWAWAQRPNLVTKLFDYDNEIGHAWSMIGKADTPYFTWSGTNYKNGSLVVQLARTAVSTFS